MKFMFNAYLHSKNVGSTKAGTVIDSHSIFDAQPNV